MLVPTVHEPGAGGPQLDELVGITQPDEPIRVADLIYPDRYDLLSRARYARYCSEHRDLWYRDQEAFIEQVRSETAWGDECDMLTYIWRHWRTGTASIRRRDAAFHMDNCKFFGAIESLERYGWLPEGKVQIIRSSNLLPGIDGRDPSQYVRNWFMADAQHRLTVWYGLLGHTEFAPEQVQILEYAHFKPFVTTPAYIEVGLLAGMDAFREEIKRGLD